MERTYIGNATEKIGQNVRLNGWIAVRRDHGKLIFFDLRDSTGLIQLVVNPKISPDAHKISNEVRNEYVVQIEGLVKNREEKLVNPNIPNGKIEIEVKDVIILNKSQPVPFDISADGHEIKEEVRLKYRYLDLRRDRLQKNLRLRSEFINAARKFLQKEGFLEIETPILSAPTPEGSRDFVVPSRLQPGKFFALPQSPQQYKQLLMVAGFEKYFQIAKCLRDEDLRSDRSFEHSQIDIEMSFVDRTGFMKLDEAMMISIAEHLGFKVLQKPFPVFTYKEAMEKFGADKFDLRSEKDKTNKVLAYAWVTDFPFFEKNDEGGWTFTHNPFSMPINEHIDWLIKGQQVEQILTTQYDLVCNGVEIGGGSIRAHKPEILQGTFKIMGYSEEKINKEFGHMIEALSFGAPPHGGIAHGIERNLMTLLGENFLRETQAFPQTSSGKTAVMDAPADLTAKQLRELHLKIGKSAD